MTGHGTPSTAAHTLCGWPSEESRGFSAPKLEGEGRWVPERPWWNRAPTQSTFRPSSMTQIHKACLSAHSSFWLPWDRAYMVLCSPLPFLGGGPDSEPVLVLSCCWLGVPTVASLTTSTSHLPVPFEYQGNTILFSLTSANSELQHLWHTRTIRMCLLRIDLGH